MTLFPARFDEWYDDERKIDDICPDRRFPAGNPRRGLVIRVPDARKLALPTGQVVARDPGRLMHGDMWPAFARAVPPRRYPVRVSVTHSGQDRWFVDFDLRGLEEGVVMAPCTATVVVSDASGRARRKHQV